MLFNSLDFAVFFPLVFCLYWWANARSITWRNCIVVAASYLFYGWWDATFLLLIIFSTGVDFTIAQRLERVRQSRYRKILLALSIGINLGLLGFFKYSNFFIDSFVSAFSFFGYPISASGSLDIILPVGISFYTFQTLSYTIDVYRRRLEPSHDPVAFAAFVSFFPQLVAGPIERATHLLPQFARKQHFEYEQAVGGLRQILWGLFKKMVIADNCALIANLIFADYPAYNGSALLIGALAFTLQIYGDFSGYSDIAIGTARLLGINLMQNFNFPYFSRDIAEFWRNWHISLTTWFRDYLYIPLGGSRGGRTKTVRNVFIIFVVSGFWHGANWTFIVWGLLNAMYFLPLLLTNRNRQHTGIVGAGRNLPSWGEVRGMIGTFSLTVLAWVFFRSESVIDALQYLGRMITSSLVSKPNFLGLTHALVTALLVVCFMAVEWRGRYGSYALENIGSGTMRTTRWVFYSLVLFAIGMYAPTDQSSFIYFQF